MEGVAAPRPAEKLLIWWVLVRAGGWVREEGDADGQELLPCEVLAGQQMVCTALEKLVFIPVISR